MGGHFLCDCRAVTLRSPCGQIARRKALDRLEMSSTLFGRGTNTQIGGKKRAEDQERAVLAVRTAVDDLKTATTTDVRTLLSKITAQEATIATLQKTVAALSTTVATLTPAVAAAEATAPPS